MARLGAAVFWLCSFVTDGARTRAEAAPDAGADATGAIRTEEVPPTADSGPAPHANPALGAAEAAGPMPPSSNAEPAGPIEVEVRVRRSDDGARLARSAAAVGVVDASEAQAEAGDLGALLSRQEGVNVQRSGGLGAPARLSLQGLGADQLRFYVDGVPLAFTGLPESLIYIPVDLVRRLELYRGVVPARFGGDTLGGALHVVTPSPELGYHGSASLSLGSFDTERGALRAQVLTERGLYAGFSGFLDRARNDYAVTAQVGQPNGKTQAQKVHRLHDRYEAGFGQVELGVLHRPYADKFLLRAFASAYAKQINHDVAMRTPYGEVLSRRRAQGASVLYEHAFSRAISLDATLGYARRFRQLRDLGACAYDWYGRCVAELPNGGEILGLAFNRKTQDDNVYLRSQLALRASKWLQLRLSVAPTFTNSRAHDSRVPKGAIDLFDQKRKLATLTLGLEHELDALRGRLENIAFVKDYLQWASAKGENVRGSFTADTQTHRGGFGDALRIRLHDMLIAKLSYELGTRLPGLDELFGDGAFVEPNLRLSPETSHNANAELTFEYLSPRAGEFGLSAVGFVRKASDFIVLLAGPNFFQFNNVADVRVLGAEGSARWISPAEYLRLDGSVTYQDSRNQAKSGPFALFEGQRIPNRPYFFANLSVTGKLRDVVSANDTLSMTFRESFVHSFYRSWEGLSAQERDVIPRQLVSTLILTYEVNLGDRAISADLEAHNLTNAKVYDFFGVQRPGRYVLAKLMFRI